MAGLWGSLLPLAIASAIVPLQLTITVLLLRSGHGRVVSLAWLAGMLTVRLGQGIVFGFGGGESGSSTAVSMLLLVVAILFLVMAARKLVHHSDEDAPPQRWMAGVESATPARAYLMYAAPRNVEQPVEREADRRRGHRPVTLGLAARGIMAQGVPGPRDPGFATAVMPRRV